MCCDKRCNRNQLGKSINYVEKFFFFRIILLKIRLLLKVAIATFMDLSTAFDCVDHNILLSKLKRYGIHKTALQWINSYLSDREHFVSWNQLLIFT